ncbi:MAG: hypothetical protein ACI4JX_04435 [Oscillospiraceae bacterium]
MKKLSLLLSILLFLSAFTACKNTSNTESSDTATAPDVISDSETDSDSDTDAQPKPLSFFEDKVVIYAGEADEGNADMKYDEFDNFTVDFKVYEDLTDEFVNENTYFIISVRTSEQEKAKELFKSNGIPVCLEHTNEEGEDFCIIADYEDLKKADAALDYKITLISCRSGLQKFYPEYNAESSEIAVAESMRAYIYEHPEKKISENVNEKLKENDKVTVKITFRDTLSEDEAYKNLDFGEGAEYYKNFNQFMIDLFKDYKFTNVRTDSLVMDSTLSEEEMLTLAKTKHILKIELA